MYEFILLPETETSLSIIENKMPLDNENIDITHSASLKIKKDLSLSTSLLITLSKEDNVFLESKVELYFNFSEATLKQLKSESKDKFTLPKDLIAHLISIVVGINRGIILCKTKEINKDFLLPLINMKELIQEDATIEISSEE